MRKSQKSRDKSWSDKLHIEKSHEVVTLEKTFSGLPPGLRLLIPTPLMVDEYIKKIAPGSFQSVSELRQQMAAEHQADHSCPLVTGIQLRIVAEAAWEAVQAGKPESEVTPFWRVVHPASPLAKKLACPAFEIARLQAQEGITPRK